MSVELWAETEQEEPCSVCGVTANTVRVVDTNEQVYVAAFCGLCLATALEGLTDQRYINLYKAWTTARRIQKEWRRYKTRRIL